MNMQVRRVRSINQNNFDDQKATQDFVKKQIYMKGFSQAIGAGSNQVLPAITTFDGSARWLHGLSIYVSQANVSDNDTFSLTVNNEQIIINAYWRAFCPEFNLKLTQYFPLPRPLAGSDSVQMNWSAQNAKTVYPIFYLSTEKGNIQST